MISIIIPTYNRFSIIEETIQKIISISTDTLFEVIIVNDGEELPFKSTHPKIKILKNPKRGAAAARNHGAANASYSILFFIDDDMWPTAATFDAITQLSYDHFLNSNCVVLNWRYPDNLIHFMSQNKIGRYLLKAGYHTLEGRLKQHVDNTKMMIQIASIGSGSFLISKELFDKCGRYNETYVFQGEDIDLSQKINEKGFNIFLFTDITCFHNQKDRLYITEFLDRDYRGFLSQFTKNRNMPTNKLKQFIFTLLIPLKPFILFIFNYIPNYKIFDKLTFRTIGVLSSISYFKAMYDARAL